MNKLKLFVSRGLFLVICHSLMTLNMSNGSLVVYELVAFYDLWCGEEEGGGVGE